MATATPTRLKDMVAVSKDSKTKPLGFIIWFSVPDEDVSLRRVKRLWQLAGLEREVLPRDPKAVDAFRRAVRSQDGIQRDAAAGRISETDVREVVNTAEDMIYQLSRVVRDEDEKVVEYPKALRVWYSKVTDALGFKPLGDIPRREVLPIMDEIQSDFESASKAITGAKVRTLVRSYIREDTDEDSGTFGLSGENLRGKAGGVYFVLAKHADKLDALADFLDELYEPHGRSYLYAVPLADSATEREMIRRRHVANTVEEMDEAISDVAALLRQDRDREVRTNVKSHHWNRLQKFRRRAAAYAEVLRDEQDDLNMRLDLLSQQLRKLA